MKIDLLNSKDIIRTIMVRNTLGMGKKALETENNITIIIAFWLVIAQNKLLLAIP